MTGFLQSLDANGDGMLNLREVPESRRGFASTMLERMGFDPSRSVSLKQLQEKMSQRGGRGSSEDEPLVPGFGVEEELPEVPTFGVRIEDESTASSNSSRSNDGNRSRNSGGNDRRQEESRGEQIAKMIFERSDRNKDGVLTKDEWGSMRGDPSEIDKDKNGKITLAEVTSRMNGRMNGEEEDEGVETYRLSTATELLPDGLPDWFKEKDTNTDGQVSMAEYSSYYDDSTAEKFVALDLNNDGIVTPIEVIEVEGPQNNDRGRSFRRPGGDSGQGGFGGRPGGFGGDSGGTFGGRTFGGTRGGDARSSGPGGFTGRPGIPGGNFGGPGGNFGGPGGNFGGPGSFGNMSDEDRQRMREMMIQRFQQNGGGRDRGSDRGGSGRRGN